MLSLLVNFVSFSLTTTRLILIARTTYNWASLLKKKIISDDNSNNDKAANKHITEEGYVGHNACKTEIPKLLGLNSQQQPFKQISLTKIDAQGKETTVNLSDFSDPKGEIDLVFAAQDKAKVKTKYIKLEDGLYMTKTNADGSKVVITASKDPNHPLPQQSYDDIMNSSSGRTIAQFIKEHTTIEDACSILTFFAAVLHEFSTTISVGVNLAATISLMLVEDPIQVGNFIDQYTKPTGENDTHTHDHL